MKNITVLVSGGGTNLQRIVDCIVSGDISDARISLVVADRSCFALKIAKNQEIPFLLIDKGKEFSDNFEKILPKDTDLIVLAGFLSILSQDFCLRWTGKIINVHPSLLPKYGGKGMWGMNVHRAVLENGEKQTGATVHYVVPEIDRGGIILQKSCLVSDHDTAETLAKKVHLLEYEILPRAINLILSSR